MKVDILHEGDNNIIDIEKYKNKLLNSIILVYSNNVDYSYNILDTLDLLILLNSFSNKFYIEMRKHNKQALDEFINRLNIVLGGYLADTIYRKLKEIW